MKPKTETTMWALLQWAYGPQRVLQSLPRPERLGYGSTSATGLVCRDMAAGAVIRAQGARTGGETHPDALAVHEYVSRLQRDERGLVIHHATLGQPPAWEPRITPCRVWPKRRGGTGRIVVVCGEFCPIETEGNAHLADTLRRETRDAYQRWWSLTNILKVAIRANDDLTRWRVTTSGVSREPWSREAQIGLDAAAQI